MRILQLMTDSPRPSDMLLAWALDSFAAAEDVRVCALGSAELPARLEAVSGGERAARPVEHFAAGAGLGRTFAAVVRLRRALRKDRPDLIHAWSLRGAAMAAWACPGVPIVLTTDTPLAAAPSAWMRVALRAARSLTWLSPHPPTADDLARLDFSHTTSFRVNPPAHAARLGEAEHDQARARRRLSWGVSEERTRIVALLSDRPETIEAMSAVLGVGLTWETGRNVRLLLSPRAGRLDRALRVLADTGRTDRVIVDAAVDQPWRIAHAVDAALVIGDGLSLAWATTAGLPTLAAPAPAAGDTAGGLAVDAGAEHELLGRIFARADSARPGRIAPHLCRLYDRYAEAQRAAAALQGRARGIYHLPTHNARLAAVYEALLEGRRVAWGSEPTAEAAAG